STMKQESSGRPSPLLPVTACTVTPAFNLFDALVIKIFAPLIFQPPSTFFAMVLLPRESEPAPGSVRPKAQSLSLQSCGMYFFFSPLLQKKKGGPTPSGFWAVMAAACDPPPRPISPQAPA